MQLRQPVLSAIIFSLIHTWPVAQADAAGTAQDGLFTLQQAERGERVYQAECASCHATDMKGGPAARGLSGLTFRYLWADRPLEALFNAMRETMPPGKPGALREQAYFDLLAAILRRNGFPPGEAELEADEQVLRSTLRWQRPD